LTRIAEDGDMEAWIAHKNVALWFATTCAALTNAQVTGREKRFHSAVIERVLIRRTYRRSAVQGALEWVLC
jgi:hypothetical protein